jgi:nucleotide-binding universal stress UspA family protein
MSGIVCAVRGGPASQPTIRRAIRAALEYELPLYFLYIVNVDFLEHTSSSRVRTITEEMGEMGEFILLASQATAAAQGVEAQGIVRQGRVTEEIVALCREKEADYLVVGRPLQESEANLLTDPLLSAFIENVEQQTGARVILSDEEREQ